MIIIYHLINISLLLCTILMVCFVVIVNCAIFYFAKGFFFYAWPKCTGQGQIREVTNQTQCTPWLSFPLLLPSSNIPSQPDLMCPNSKQSLWAFLLPFNGRDALQVSTSPGKCAQTERNFPRLSDSNRSALHRCLIQSLRCQDFIINHIGPCHTHYFYFSSITSYYRLQMQGCADLLFPSHWSKWLIYNVLLHFILRCPCISVITLRGIE